MNLFFALLACSPAPRSERLRVLAASSLSGAATEMARVFEAENPGVEVELVFAGSQALATQVEHGLAADVFASADPRQADRLLRGGLLGDVRTFATNRLALVGASGLEELAGVGSIVLGGEAVPLGAYTEQLLERATSRMGRAWREAVQRRVVSREPNARLVITKVVMGEADAAIVYRSDAQQRGLPWVELSDTVAPTPTYVHGVLEGSATWGPRWLEFVEGPGRAILAEHGFGTP